MKKLKKTMVAAMVLFFSVAVLQTADVQAAKKKLTVNRVYNTTTKVKGKTKKKYTVKIKIGKKTYKARANKKGKFTVKIPKQPAGKKLTVKAYKGKKLYKTKKIYVIAKTASISKFSKTAKNIKGYTRPKYTVKITINGKTYNKKASKVKGYFNIKLKKAAGNTTATIKVYNTKGKLWKTYKKKAYNASSSSNNSNENNSNVKVPGKEDPIDETQLNKDIATAEKTKKVIDKSVIKTNVNDTYAYYIRPKDGYIHIGYLRYYMTTDADGSYAKFTAKNGVTLYGCVGRGKMDDIKEPTTDSYDFKLTSGQTKKYQGTDVPAEPDADYATRTGLTYKVKGYKNGKLVLIDYSSQYLIAGYSDK